MDSSPRRPWLWRFIPIAIALGMFWFVAQRYGTHPVELLVSIPAAVDDGRSGIGLRIVRPDGKLVVQIEQAERPPAGHTIVVRTRLPRGEFRVEGWLLGTEVRLRARIHYEGEDAIEVTLSVAVQQPG